MSRFSQDDYEGTQERMSVIQMGYTEKLWTPNLVSKMNDMVLKTRSWSAPLFSHMQIIGFLMGRLTCY